MLPTSRSQPAGDGLHVRKASRERRDPQSARSAERADLGVEPDLSLNNRGPGHGRDLLLSRSLQSSPCPGRAPFRTLPSPPSVHEVAGQPQSLPLPQLALSTLGLRRGRKKGTGSRPRTTPGISGNQPVGRVPVPLSPPQPMREALEPQPYAQTLVGRAPPDLLDLTLRNPRLSRVGLAVGEASTPLLSWSGNRPYGVILVCSGLPTDGLASHRLCQDRSPVGCIHGLFGKRRS